MVGTINKGHQYLYILVEHLVLTGVAEYLAHAHIDLVDNAKPLRLTRYINARRTILSIVVDVREVLVHVVEFKVDTQVGCLFSFQHLIVASLLVIQNFNKV